MANFETGFKRSYRLPTYNGFTARTARRDDTGPEGRSGFWRLDAPDALFDLRFLRSERSPRARLHLRSPRRLRPPASSASDVPAVPRCLACAVQQSATLARRQHPALACGLVVSPADNEPGPSGSALLGLSIRRTSHPQKVNTQAVPLTLQFLKSARHWGMPNARCCLSIAAVCTLEGLRAASRTVAPRRPVDLPLSGRTRPRAIGNLSPSKATRGSQEQRLATSQPELPSAPEPSLPPSCPPPDVEPNLKHLFPAAEPTDASAAAADVML